MAAYPLFQKTLTDSTPFPGTMAETSTPTPTGELPQTPVANEAPGDSGNRVRLKKIQEDRSLIQQQLQFLSTMKYNPSNKWSEAIHLGLNGKVTEPVDYVYKKHAAMAEYLRADAQLAEEERLLSTPNPIAAADAADASDRARRQAEVNLVNEHHRIMGLPPVPMEYEVQFVEKGYSLDQSIAKAAGGDDQIKAMIGEANLGQEVGEEGLPVTGLTGRSRDVAAAGARHAAQLRQEQADKEERAAQKPLPVLGLFKTPGELLGAMNKDYQDALRIEGNYHMEKVESMDPMSKPTERMAWNAEEKKAARAYAAARWDGYEKYFPNYIEKGFGDVPVVDPKQGDVEGSVNATRQRLKAKAAEKK